MVLPTETPGKPEPRVRAVRDAQGRIVGFQDPDKGGRFISRSDAIRRVSVDVETNEIRDSFGNRVGIGSLAIPGRGIEVAYKIRSAEYKPLTVNPEDFRPNADQELIERTVFIGRDGKLMTAEISYGGGGEYDPAKNGGKWRYEASKALDLPSNVRLPTQDLQRAVAYTEFVVKTIR